MFTGCMICAKKKKMTPKKPGINAYSKVAGYKVNTQKPVLSHVLDVEKWTRFLST